MKKTFATAYKLIFILVMAACSNSASKTDSEQVASVKQAGDLPDLNLIPEEGQTFSSKSLSGNTILIFFAPDCDHCQRQATAIEDHVASFKKYSVYFISMDSFEALHAFAKTYKLDDKENFSFVRAQGKSVIDALGDVSTPTICIYDENKKLVKRFDGETPIDEILVLL